MERRRMPGLKTYGRVNGANAKYKKRASTDKDNRVPLMSWNDLINRSDSFDRLTKTSEVEKINSYVLAEDGADGYADENVKSLKKQRRGLSLKKKLKINGEKKKAFQSRQSRDHVTSPTKTGPYTHFINYKPYPPCSPIEPILNSEDTSKMSLQQKTIYDNFIKIKGSEREEIVEALQRVLRIKDSPEKEKDIPLDNFAVAKTASVPRLTFQEDPSLLKVSSTTWNLGENLHFRATSTPTGQSATSTITFSSFRHQRESDIMPPGAGFKEMQSICHSLNFENDFYRSKRLNPQNPESFGKTNVATNDSHDCLENDSENVAVKIGSLNLPTFKSALKTTMPSLSGCEINRTSFLTSVHNVEFENHHHPVRNESEATTVPMEASLSLHAATHCTLSSLRQSCSLMQESLMSLCSQPEILDFETCFPKRQMKTCSKVGEGVYGEVFAVTISTELLILKVVPFEGDFEVNGTTQKKFEDIQNEAIVSRELSDLRIGERCSTYIRLIKTYCIKGKYPKPLLRAWQQYHRKVGSENENPKVFDTDQLFMVFVYENGGCDLEKYKFSSAAQAKSAFLQISCALAVAEEALHFEHRDLHWGNVLISKTDSPIISFKISKNQPIQINSEGISVRIIDYSICRMQKGRSKIIFTDLSDDDELFNGQGDHQFEVYRMMKALNNNNWKDYKPKSNIYWLSYILEKLCSKVKCCRSNTDQSTNAIKLLEQLQELVPSFTSSLEFASEWNNKWGTLLS